MLMPKATVNENNGFQARKNEVGLSRQVLAMEAIPEAKRVSNFPNCDFRLHILASNRSHILAAPRGT
jgi:hypothetical protein